MKKKFLSLIMVGVLVLGAAVLTGCGSGNDEAAAGNESGETIVVGLDDTSAN